MHVTCTHSLYRKSPLVADILTYGADVCWAESRDKDRSLCAFSLWLLKYVGADPVDMGNSYVQLQYSADSGNHPLLSQCKNLSLS